MKTSLFRQSIVLSFALIFAASATMGRDKKESKKEIYESMKKVADWQIENMWIKGHGRAVYHPTNWTNGALFAGMMKWANLSDDTTYLNFLKRTADKVEWKLGKRLGLYHADEHAIGQMYLEMYRKLGDKEMMDPTIKQLEYILYHPAKTSLQLKVKTPFNQDRWSWSDALFMSPPVWAKAYGITGDKRYLDFMFSEYKATTDYLFDKEESLYYRDDNYFEKRDNGTKIFWSRGNGWVFAGLTDIIRELDKGSEEYNYFVDLYKKMAKRLKEIQTPEGYWAMSLLGAEFYPSPETSGTGFFTYGFAWGINNGLLDKKEYEEVAWKGWNALQRCVTEDGMLGYVQPIGAAPGSSWPDKTEVYGVGAYLSAGTEIYKLAKK